MKGNGKLYIIYILKAISSKIMIQKHVYALHVFTVQSNGGVVTTCRLWRFNPTPGEGPIPRFCVKMTAKNALAVSKNHFALKIERFRLSGKNLRGSNGLKCRCQ